VILQPVHLVGVSANVIWVTSQAPRGEHLHRFEMFAIRKYLVITPENVAPLLGNRRSVPKQSVPKELWMGSTVNAQVWSGYDHPVLSLGTF